MKRTRYDPEVVDLPDERLKQKYEVEVEFTPAAWPDSRFQIQLDWSNALDRYCWALRLVGHGQVVPQVPISARQRRRERDGLRDSDREMPGAPVTLEAPHTYRDFIRFVWVDPAGEALRPTHRNVGDSVELQCWPGPDSPAFVPLSRIQAQVFDDAREPLHDYLDVPTSTILQPGVP